MKALTVRQPFAWAIAIGQKTVENRTRATKHRGLLAIHAGKTVYRADPDDRLILDAIAENEFAVGEAESSLGAVVAVAELRGCHHAHDCMPPVGVVPPSGLTGCSPWAMYGQYHWKLANVRSLPEPVPCKGSLGLWRLPEDVERAVTEQLDVLMPIRSAG